MKTKNSFFMLLILLTFGIQQSYAAAPLARPALASLSRHAQHAMMPRIASHQKPQALPAAHHLQTHRALTTNSSPYMPAQEQPESASTRSELDKQSDYAHQKNGIYDYEPQDEKALVEIGMQHADPLAIDVEADLVNVLSSSSDTNKNKVYFCDGIPVGFTSYAFTPQWHKKFVPNSPVGPNVYIRFLAVRNNCHSKGIGSKLLQAVLDDCNAHSVNRIDLITRDSVIPQDLATFYSKFGFKVVWLGRYGDTVWSKKLKLSARFMPHPMLALTIAQCVTGLAILASLPYEKKPSQDKQYPEEPKS